MIKENDSTRVRRKARLFASHLETTVGDDEAFERAERRAVSLLDQGFHLGGVIRNTRDEWHER